MTTSSWTPSAPGLTSATKVGFGREPRPVPLIDLATPLLTIDLDALDHNVGTMAAWCREAGVDLAPHGKTTMAPEIWRRQLDAGAWGITLATAFQVAVAREAGVPTVVMAGTAFAPATLAALAAPGVDVLMWVDSVETVRLVDAALARAEADRPLAVLVEFGSPLGRTGARSVREALLVVEAVTAAPHLVLAGVAGYEGALTHDVDPAGIAVVDDYLRGLLEVFDGIDGPAFDPWLSSGHDVVVSAGGSVYFDRVVAVLGGRHDPSGLQGPRTRVVLRSGSYVAHDHDLYRRLTPFARDTVPTTAGGAAGTDADVTVVVGDGSAGTAADREMGGPTDGELTGLDGAAEGFGPERSSGVRAGASGEGAAGAASGPSFLPALELWASVVSRPEPGLALLNVGRRDTSDDEGLPVPLEAWRPQAADRRLPGVLDGSHVSALNDQHAFLRLDPSSGLQVGDLVRLGVSHPCTTIDKWNEIATVRGAADRRGVPPVVEGGITTRF
ncbi:alanine racemase [Frigoribacterium sp. VKM Ac-2836]|uniref:alanine racemase n=1 Tax=Frigoribacterium sp. VKM Ac-2836 TaxID=2739014 RepID=UPI001564C30E|nr:alanine racemase [Frigoribacterium sp. VKM Ac-2836]NRD26785.1 alanine racemase [Frigoribacterium sp. VKM Ac-2836]